MQSSQVPYLELKVPPPLCCAYSETTPRAQRSQAFAISRIDIGCDKLRKDMLNLDFAFSARSSFPLLPKYNDDRCHVMPLCIRNSMFISKIKVNSGEGEKWDVHCVDNHYLQGKFQNISENTIKIKNSSLTSTLEYWCILWLGKAKLLLPSSMFDL